LWQLSAAMRASQCKQISLQVGTHAEELMQLPVRKRILNAKLYWETLSDAERADLLSVKLSD